MSSSSPGVSSPSKKRFFKSAIDKTFQFAIIPSSGNVRSYAILLKCLQLLLGAFLFTTTWKSYTQTASCDRCGSFYPLGTPRDSCGFDYILHPLDVAEPFQVTNYKHLATRYSGILATTRAEIVEKKFVKSHKCHPVPPCEGVECEWM